MHGTEGVGGGGGFTVGNYGNSNCGKTTDLSSHIVLAIKPCSSVEVHNGDSTLQNEERKVCQGVSKLCRE